MRVGIAVAGIFNRTFSHCNITLSEDDVAARQWRMINDCNVRIIDSVRSNTWNM